MRLYAYVILLSWFIVLVSNSVAGAQISAEKFCQYIRFLAYHKDPNIIVWVTDKVAANVEKAPFDCPYWGRYFERLEQQRGQNYAHQQIKNCLLKFPDNTALQDYAFRALYPDFLKERQVRLKETPLSRLAERERFLAFLCFLKDKKEGKVKKVAKWVLKHNKVNLNYYPAKILALYSSHLHDKDDFKGAVRYTNFIVKNYKKCDWIKDFAYRMLLHIWSNHLKNVEKLKAIAKEYINVCPYGLLAKRSEIELLLFDSSREAWDKILFMWTYIDIDEVMRKEVLNALEKCTNYDSEDANSNLLLANLLSYRAPSATLEYANRYLELTGDAKSIANIMAVGYYGIRDYEKAYKWACIDSPTLGELMFFGINLYAEDWDKIKPLAEDWYKKYILNKNSRFKKEAQTNSTTSSVWPAILMEGYLISWYFHNKEFDKVIEVLEGSKNLQKGNLVPLEELLKKMMKNKQLNYVKIIDAFEKMIFDQSYISQQVLNLQRLLFIEYLKWQSQPDSELIKIISSQYFLNGLKTDLIENLLKIAREKKLETLHLAITAFCIWGPYYYHSDFIINEITEDFIKEWQKGHKGVSP